MAFANMLKLENFCCKYDLKCGTLVIGGFSTFCSICYFLFACISAVTGDQPPEHYKTAIPATFSGLIINGLTFYGGLKESAVCLLPYLVLMGSLIVVVSYLALVLSILEPLVLIAFLILVFLSLPDIKTPTMNIISSAFSSIFTKLRNNFVGAKDSRHCDENLYLDYSLANLVVSQWDNEMASINMFKMDKFCCRYDLRCGTFLVGGFTTFSSICYCLFEVVGALNGDQPSEHYKIAIPAAFSGLLIHSLILCGALRQSSAPLLPFLIIGGSLLVVLCYLGVILSFLYPRIIFGFLLLVPGTYFWITIYSYYQSLSSNSTGQDSIDLMEKNKFSPPIQIPTNKI